MTSTPPPDRDRPDSSDPDTSESGSSGPDAVSRAGQESDTTASAADSRSAQEPDSTASAADSRAGQETDSTASAADSRSAQEPDVTTGGIPLDTTRMRRIGPVGSVLAVLAVVGIAVNLRAGATSPGPIIEPIIQSFGQGALAAGLITALPPLTFGILGFLAVPISRRAGLTGAVVIVFALTVAGLLLRPLVDSLLPFLLLSMLALMGPALANVTVPAWIKLHGGSVTVILMTLYTTLLAVGGTAGSMLSVPLLGEGADGWRRPLFVWGLVALLPLVIWAMAWRRTGHDFPPQSSRGEIRGSIWRSPTAIALTLMFALQSTNAYTQFGFLPLIFTEAGLTPLAAGALTAVPSAWGIVGGLVMPSVIARTRRLAWLALGFGLLTAAGYTGILLAPSVVPLLWVSLLGIGGFAFPTAIAMIPARTRDSAVTARLSGMVQPIAYVLAATGPIILGIVLERTGSTSLVLGLLTVAALALGLAGWRAGANTMVDDEIGA